MWTWLVSKDATSSSSTSLFHGRLQVQHERLCHCRVDQMCAHALILKQCCDCIQVNVGSAAVTPGYQAASIVQPLVWGCKGSPLLHLTQHKDDWNKERFYITQFKAAEEINTDLNELSIALAFFPLHSKSNKKKILSWLTNQQPSLCRIKKMWKFALYANLVPTSCPKKVGGRSFSFSLLFRFTRLLLTSHSSTHNDPEAVATVRQIPDTSSTSPAAPAEDGAAAATAAARLQVPIVSDVELEHCLPK